LCRPDRSQQLPSGDAILGRDYAAQNCSVARSLEVIGERWTLLILRDAFIGVTRFETFQRRLGLATNVLATRLKSLVQAGILERRMYAERPERFEYVLTPTGEDLLPVIIGLMAWGDVHLAPNGPPAIARHASCGGTIGVGAVCRSCGTQVRARDVEWLLGPGVSKGAGRPIRVS
jgi:DNA-binding HxlR family transcriptional regulator